MSPCLLHGLKRLVCISEDGFTTLSALKWLADVGASFVVLNRNGKVLFVTGPTAPSDARLRRAQALALGNGVGLEVSRALIDAKLDGQERLVRDHLNDSATAQVIVALRQRLTRENFDVGRKTAQHPDFLAKRSHTQRMHKQAIQNWNPADLPAWITRDVYVKLVQPRSRASQNQKCV
jgi:CRISPR/Cas system-associated endonuclease Cas1